MWLRPFLRKWGHAWGSCSPEQLGPRRPRPGPRPHAHEGLLSGAAPPGRGPVEAGSAQGGRNQASRPESGTSRPLWAQQKRAEQGRFGATRTTTAATSSRPSRAFPAPGPSSQGRARDAAGCFLSTKLPSFATAVPRREDTAPRPASWGPPAAACAPRCATERPPRRSPAQRPRVRCTAGAPSSASACTVTGDGTVETLLPQELCSPNTEPSLPPQGKHRPFPQGRVCAPATPPGPQSPAHHASQASPAPGKPLT